MASTGMLKPCGLLSVRDVYDVLEPGDFNTRSKRHVAEFQLQMMNA